LLAAYVSGHGFGHATRLAEVLRVVRERAPELPVVVTTSAPRFLFLGVVPPPLGVRPKVVDVGVVQEDALLIDEPGTAEAWRRFDAGWDALVREEARWLRDARARLVVGDIPPLAFAAARAAGVPALAHGNFSWDWIYRHLATRQPALSEAADRAAEAYAGADGLLRLPFAGDMPAFRNVRDVPLVARRPLVPKAEARRRLALDARKTALVTFGGIGVPGLGARGLGAIRGWQFLVTGPPVDGFAANVRHLSTSALAAAGLVYPDLVGAADVVVTKPGYGIVSDCVGAGTRLVYTDRGDFPEYPIMVAEMPRYLPAVHVPNDDVREGRLGAALAEVTALPWPDPPRTDGASVVADALLAALVR
jgi:L-arabinokinase